MTMEDNVWASASAGASSPEFWRAFEDFQQVTEAPSGTVFEDRIQYDVGREGFFLCALYASGDPTGDPLESQLQVALVIDQPHARTYFAMLHGQRPQIEAALGEHLVWSCLGSQVPCRIYAQRPANLHDHEAWLEYQAWLHDQLERFQRVFGSRIQKIFLDGLAA